MTAAEKLRDLINDAIYEVIIGESRAWVAAGYVGENPVPRLMWDVMLAEISAGWRPPSQRGFDHPFQQN